MPHLLDRKDIARIRIQAEFEDIYSKTNKFIQTATVRENKNEVELATLRDELKKFCDDCCGKFEEKLTDLQSVVHSLHQLEIKENILCVIGNLKKNSSEFYQHLTIKLPHTIVSTKRISDIRGVINATIAQINYINAQNNYINAQNYYINAQNNYINAQNNYTSTIAQKNNTIAQNSYTIAQNNYTIAQNNYTFAQNNYTIAQNKNAIAQNGNTSAQNNNTIVQNNYTIAQNNNAIAQNNNTIVQNNNTIVQNNYTIAQNNNAIAQNNYTIAQNSNTSAQNSNTSAQTNNTSAQNSNTSAQTNNTIAQNSNTINEVEFSLVLTDTPEDTCSSFVYTLKCSDCDEYYVGRTHYGEQECFNDITTYNEANRNSPSAVYIHTQAPTRHTFKIDDMQKVFSCCEDNKLRILESLLIKRHIVRETKFLNIYVMKKLTIFQYNENEIKKARSQLTMNTDRLGDAANNEPAISEFSESDEHTDKIRGNDELLTLLQAEFENFYDKTQIFIKEDKDSKDKYFEDLTRKCNEIAVRYNKQRISWNEDKTRIFIKDDKDSKDKYIEDLTKECDRIADNHDKLPISWNKDNTQIFIKYCKDKYIARLIFEYNRIAAKKYIEPKSWNEVVIGNIKYEEKSWDGTVKSKQNNLVIKLPDIECSHIEFKESIREFLSNSMEERYSLEEYDIPEDTRTSIIYLMKCNNSNCDRKLYIGLTHRGKETRFKEHTETHIKSAVYQHIHNNHGHGFNIEDMETLEVCCDDNKLKILESLYIKEYLLKRNKLLNKKLEEEQLALFAYTEEERTMVTEFMNN